MLRKIMPVLILAIGSLFTLSNPAFAGFDETVNAALAPISKAVSSFIFFSVPLNGADIPLIVVWLIACSVFFTFYLRVLTPRNIKTSLKMVRGDYTDPNDEGQISHFKALTTALSGTVGVGNIGAVAFAITIGGPGALFWIIVGGLLGASLKCAECTLGVKYRTKHQDGSVSGGPMYYLEEGLKEKTLPRLGKIIGCMYAGFIVIGCLGIGNMFQSNQAYEQLQLVTGGADGFLFGKGWLVGGIMAFIVALVLIGGIQSITRVTSKLVPGMAGIYFIAALIVISLNIEALPGVIADVVTQAFNPAGITGGLFAVMIIGFRRSTFSNEAGLGSSSIAHAAVKTNQPASEGLVGLLEPLIDTVIICPLTGLVILLTVFSPEMVGGDVQGVQLTSAAFETVIWWFPNVLAIVIVLFAFSSIIAWGYYGQKGWIYLFGNDPVQSKIFLLIYCVFVLIGCTLDLGVIIDFSDAIVFCMALPNVLGLYFLAPVVKREVGTYLEKLRSVET